MTSFDPSSEIGASVDGGAPAAANVVRGTGFSAVDVLLVVTCVDVVTGVDVVVGGDAVTDVDVATGVDVVVGGNAVTGINVAAAVAFTASESAGDTADWFAD